jgi:hypothetical protein
MPSIAIGKRMNLNETMVQADRGFRRRVSLIFSPIFRIADKSAERHSNMNGIDADVFSGPSKPARPVPHVAEQAFVQGNGKVNAQNVCPLAAKPAQAGLEVGLFQLIELALRYRCKGPGKIAWALCQFVEASAKADQHHSSARSWRA